MIAKLTLNTTSAIRAITHLQTQGPLAISRALNKSIASGQTVMVRLIAADLGMKQADLRDKILVVSATPDNHTAQLKASAKRIPLYDREGATFKAKGPYPSRGRGRGVSYSIGGRRATIPNAFIARMTSGHTGVFTRTGTRRLPIQEKFGPSIAHVFSKHVAAGQARALEQLAKNLPSELKFVMRQAA